MAFSDGLCPGCGHKYKLQQLLWALKRDREKGVMNPGQGIITQQMINSIFNQNSTTPMYVCLLCLCIIFFLW